MKEDQGRQDDIEINSHKGTRKLYIQQLRVHTVAYKLHTLKSIRLNKDLVKLVSVSFEKSSMGVDETLIKVKNKNNNNYNGN